MIKCILLLLLLVYVRVDAACNPGWTASDGTTCQMYSDMEFCDDNFGYGAGWQESWGLFHDHSVNGESAMVCPQCGCDDSVTPCTPVYTKLSRCGPMYNDMYCYDPNRPFCDLDNGWCSEHSVESFNFVTNTYVEPYDYYTYWVTCLASYLEDWGCYGRCGFSTTDNSCYCNPDCEHEYGDCCANYESACNQEVPGCNDIQAYNYDPYANTNDGSCIFGIPGCTDPLADNYQVQATHEDGSCVIECYYFEFQCGVFCSENTYTIVYARNQEVVCEAVGSNTVGGCCLPAPHCGYDIIMEDSMDDGWNGGKLIIHNQEYTLTSGSIGYDSIEQANCEAIKNEGCTDSAASNYHISNNVDDGSCLYAFVCTTCCSHAECPSGNYCAMGTLGDWDYNMCKVIDYCTQDNDSVDDSCDNTDTGNDGGDDCGLNCCSHSDCDATDYCSFDDGYAGCYILADCYDYDDAIDGTCPGSNGGNTGDDGEGCSAHEDCDADMYCANNGECYPLFECGQWDDEVSPCPSSDSDDNTDDNTDDGNNDDNDGPVVYCTDCCSHADCNSDQYCAIADYNGFPFTTCDALSNCGQYDDEIEPCPIPLEVYVSDGCPGPQSEPAIVGAYELESNTNYARCCGDGGCSTPMNCNNDSPVNYNDAKAKCENIGKQLCTKDELDGGACCGKGGACDDWPVWTSTEIEPEDCAGVSGGSAVEDACGECGGDGSSCEDCAGVPAGGATVDSCGVCGGNGLSCVDMTCAEYAFTCGTYCSEISWVLKDKDGQTKCSGVSGVAGECCPVYALAPYTLVMSDSYGDGWTGGKLLVGVGEFTMEDGSESSVQIISDCNGDLGGSSVKDACNICGGDGESCKDCNGVPNGGAMVDICDVCGGDGSSCTAGCLDYSFTPGSYVSEVSWQLKQGNTVVCSSDGNGVLNEDDCCPMASVAYTLVMSDSYGDGWNGGKLKIGTETYTLENGASEEVEIGSSGSDSGLVSQAWIADGCPGSQGGDPVVDALTDLMSTSFVRCCGSGGSCTTPFACSGTPVSYNEAATMCKSEGKRLCTKDELASSRCCGKGGACDDFSVWTSTGADGEMIGDCWGVIGGSAVEDKCGVCGGDGSSCAVGCLPYTFVCGEWCGEVSWQLQMGGTTICSGSGGNTVEAACCPEPIYDFTLKMQDSYGDGWNGGKLTIGGEEYTLADGPSETVQIAATVAGPAANTAYTVSSVASLSIGANDDPNEAASVAAAAFGNTLGGAPGSTSYSILGRRERRALGQALDVEITMTTDSADAAATAAADAAKPTFASSMASEMANVAAEQGVSVTVESLEASAPVTGSIATGCPSLPKDDCKADESCDWNNPVCSDKIPGCLGNTKKSTCRDAGCTWNVDTCEETLPGCAGYVKKKNCRGDTACQWDKAAESCVPQLSGCAAHGSKSQCWKDTALVCTWNFDTEKCVDAVCTDKEKKECKKSPKCDWTKKGDDSSKTCYDTEE